MRLNPYAFFCLKYDVHRDGTIYRKKTGKELKGSLNLSASGNYYRRVSFRLFKQRVSLYVHRIVCFKYNKVENFDLLQVDHINRNTLDNRASNLRFVSAYYNLQRRELC